MCSLFLRFYFSLFWQVNDVSVRKTKKGLPFNTRLFVAIMISICCGALCLYILNNIVGILIFFSCQEKQNLYRNQGSPFWLTSKSEYDKWEIFCQQLILRSSVPLHLRAAAMITLIAHVSHHYWGRSYQIKNLKKKWITFGHKPWKLYPWSLFF